MFAGVPASLSAFAVAFAGVPASLSAFAVAFAGVPQVSRHLPWRLREFPQVSRHLPWRLRESRKSRGICRGVSADTGEFGRGRLRTPAKFAGGVCGRRRSWPGTRRPSCRQGRGVLHTPHQTTRYGADDHIRRPSIRACGPVWCWFVGGCAPLVCWCGYPCRRRNSIRPTGRHHRWRIHVPGVWSFIPCGMFGGRMRYAPTVVRAFGTCIRPLSGPSGGRMRYAPTLTDEGAGTRPNFPASAEAVLIGISVRLHLAFASGFLSVCEGKGLYVRRACQYVILRISSRPCTWPECSFYRRPIYCLSAPYASRGVPEIHEL